MVHCGTTGITDFKQTRKQKLTGKEAAKKEHVNPALHKHTVMSCFIHSLTELTITQVHKITERSKQNIFSQALGHRAE